MPTHFLFLIVCVLLSGCQESDPRSDASHIYTSALLELIPEVGHYTIQAEKVRLGAGDFMPDLEEINEYGAFSFADSNSLFTEGDFPDFEVTLLFTSDIDELSSGDCRDFWINFPSKYTPSTGFIRLSDVGFDQIGRTFVGTAGNRNGWRRRQQYSTPLPAAMDAIVADARHAGMGGRIAINSQDYDFN